MWMRVSVEPPVEPPAEPPVELMVEEPPDPAVVSSVRHPRAWPGGLRAGRRGGPAEPERGEGERQRGQVRHLDDLVPGPRRLERVLALSQAAAFEPARLRVHDPVVRESARCVALSLPCSVV